MSARPSITAFAGGIVPKRPRFYSQVQGSRGGTPTAAPVSTTQRLTQRRITRDIEEDAAGIDEEQFQVIGYFVDPNLGVFKLPDRRSPATAYEKENILNIDPNYRRVLLIGSTRRVWLWDKSGSETKPAHLQHMKGPQWIFDELEHLRHKAAEREERRRSSLSNY